MLAGLHTYKKLFKRFFTKFDEKAANGHLGFGVNPDYSRVKVRAELGL